MNETTKRILFIVGVIVVIFIAYIANTHEQSELVITEKDITVEELSNSPFMDHTNDVKNYIEQKHINFREPISSKDSVNYKDIFIVS